MNKAKKTVRKYLQEEWSSNSGHITKKAILDNCVDYIGSYLTYADIEGKYMAVYSYWEHKVENFDQVENDKYVGYEITCDFDKTNWLLENYGKPTIQLIVPTWVMDLKVNDERHAANIFRKYLKLV